MTEGTPAAQSKKGGGKITENETTPIARQLEAIEC